MSKTSTEAWLAALQSRFGSVLRMPLAIRDGALQADVERYPAVAVADVLASARLSAGERLRVYHRQYWMRLLRTLQEQYPLTTALCGAWSFNQHAIAFLSARPPTGHDLGAIAEGFEAFLSEAVHDAAVRNNAGESSLPRRAVLQAASIDAAFRHVFYAPEQPAFRMVAGDEALVATRRLRLSESLRLVQEHWPLMQLRMDVLRSRNEVRAPLPAELAAPQVWAVYRTLEGVTHVALDSDAARLLELLQQRTLPEALGQLEAERAPEARAGLPERMQALLASAVRAGFFSGWTEP